MQAQVGISERQRQVGPRDARVRGRLAHQLRERIAVNGVGRGKRVSLLEIAHRGGGLAAEVAVAGRGAAGNAAVALPAQQVLYGADGVRVAAGANRRRLGARVKIVNRRNAGDGGCPCPWPSRGAVRAGSPAAGSP